jgi:hypothetical protein
MDLPARKTTTDLYVLVLEPSHPKADREGYVLEHRLVMEGRVGPRERC